MSRRLLTATRTGATIIPPDPLPGGGDGGWTPPPYDPGTVPAVPTSAPWHRSEPCDIPTYDGYDQTLHPSVVDFGGKWNGYRWWMIHTPYPVGTGLTDGAPDTHENPSLAASNDCVNWTPIGNQPLVPRPTPDTGHFNSDNELVWNPKDARFELWYRSNYPTENLWHMHSGNGLSWSSRVSATVPSGSVIGWQAPCIVRYADNDWRMWDRYSPDSSNGVLRRSTATSPEGPWSAPVTCTSIGTPTSQTIEGTGVWHAGIARHAGSETLYALAHAASSIFAAKSVDGGLSWKWASSPVLAGVDGTWTAQGMYRPFPVLHENGTHMRVWYSGRSAALGWRIGYAELPLTIWPTI